MRPLSSLLQRHLVRQLIDEEAREGRLNHFGPIAATGGLLDLLCDFIRQMKRLEIWPEQFAEACRQRGVTDKDRELLAIYRAYQQRLVEHNLYDAEGCFWSARDLLHRQPIAYQLIVADGFSDFTRTEHDILQDLAAQAGEMWISLPMEGEVGCVERTEGEMVGSAQSRTPENADYSSGPVRVTHHESGENGACALSLTTPSRVARVFSSLRRIRRPTLRASARSIHPSLRSARTSSRSRRKRWPNCGSGTRTSAWKRSPGL